MYLFLYFRNIKQANAIAISSAAGVASQIPVTPKNNGSANKQITMNTKEREKARIAETIPLFKAVNIPLEKILNPINNNAILQILFPVTASSNTGLSGLAKMLTSGFVMIKDAAKKRTEITAMIFKLLRISFLSFS